MINQKMPRKLHLFINKQCNLSCKYCYWKEHPKEEMSIETMDKVIKYINDNEGKYDYVVFFGGEPMLSYKLLARFIKKVGTDMKYIIMTNGSIHPGLLLGELDQSYNLCFTVSYDGIYQEDRSPKITEQILKHIEYLNRSDEAICCVASILSPFHYKKIVDNMINTMQLVDSAIFFRICNVRHEWPADDLRKHINDFNRIVEIGAYYTVVKEKKVWLSNRIDKALKTEGDNMYGSKAHCCQRSLVHTDICGTDGRKYLCEPAFANDVGSYGFLWENNDSAAVRYCEKHPGEVGHYCLLYGTKCEEYDDAMEKMRNKFQSHKKRLENLRAHKEKYLKGIDPKGRMFRIANHYFRNR